MARPCTVILLLLLVLLAAPRVAVAQTQQATPAYIPVLRLDALGGRRTAVQLGAGIALPVSNGFDIGGTAAAGIGSGGFSGRVDGYGRFSLDPYHLHRWEPYLGGGATVRLDPGGPGTRAYLLGFIGVNGPAIGDVTPGFELGLGGGARFGVILRWSGSRHRP